MSDKGYDRSRIRDIKKKLTNRQVFTSRAFTKNMEKIANSLVWKSGKKIKVVMDWDTSPSAIVAVTGGKRIRINAANEITRCFPTKELKTESLVGLLGHECGHQKYTAMNLLSQYGEGFGKGKIYPRPPVPENEKESEALEEIKEFLQTGDKAAVSVITGTALRIQNVLEDQYTEMRMCDEYPGSIRKGILMNASRQIESLPTVTQEINQHHHGLVIMLNLILGYARAGEINNWEGYSGEYLDCLNNCTEIIDESIVNVDKVERFRAANQLLLKIWDYMKDMIEKMHEKEQEAKAPGESENQEETESQGETENQGEVESQENRQEEAEQLLEDLFSQTAALMPEVDEEPEESGEVPEDWDGKWENEEENQDETEEKDEKEAQDQEKPVESASEEADETSDYMEESADEDSSSQEDGQEENLLEALLQLFRDSVRLNVSQEEGGRFEGASVCEAAVGESANWKDNDYEGNGYLNAAEDMNRILYNMAEEKYEKEKEKEVLQALKRQVETINFGDYHSGCAIEIHRIDSVSAQCQKMYDSLSPDILKLARRLEEEMQDILYPDGEYMEKNLHIGKRIDGSRLYRQDKAIFMNKRISEDGGQAAIGVLIDESGSMSWGDRITYGRLTALIIYKVCINMGVPVIVYGHSTSYDSSYAEEIVDLYAYAEFDSIDGKDCYRIMDISPRGSNRDGAALRYVGERLKTRPEDLKLLFLVSDGQPAALNYSGDLAKEDLRSLKTELKREGILLFAAAIGDDQQVIEDIYQEGFINISDLSMLPVRIVKKIVSYLR
ncbi:MAG: hypothetical protein LBT06_10410 [Hungatella sp.]|jgi:hypothetical protein|nr:hypothetical protein [Hungatella sp.]